MATIREALELAFDHYQAGRRAEAAELCRRIVDADGHEADAWHLLGILAGENGDLAGALHGLGRAVALRPGRGDMATNLRRVLDVAGQTALPLVQAAWRWLGLLMPADDDGVTAWALAQRNAGNLAAATAWQRRAVRLNPAIQPYCLLMADYLNAGDVRAVPACHDVLVLAPDEGQSWAYLGHQLGGLAGVQPAWRALARAVSLDPDNMVYARLLWDARRAAGLDGEYYSYEGQDAFVHRRFFPDKRGGVFIDIGAYDGITWSNSCFFEKELGWQGLCIEASPARYRDYLAGGRLTPCLNIAVGDHDGEGAFLEVTDGMTMTNGLLASLEESHRRYIEENAGAQRIITVPVRRLDGLLREHGIGHIDFLTIDVEGAELAILQTIDWDAVTIDVLCLECLGDNPTLDALMMERSYCLVRRFAGGDRVYVRRGFLPRGYSGPSGLVPPIPRVSFCP